MTTFKTGPRQESREARTENTREEASRSEQEETGGLSLPPPEAVIRPFDDARAEATAQRELRDIAQQRQQIMNPQQMSVGQLIQRKETAQPVNKTGLPDHLKAGLENLSSMSMDDVKVHHNSPEPSQLQALAYTEGTDIHLAPGQEKHLPHEAWHVVQQKQGRVTPTMQLKDEQVNDDSALEREADTMGAQAAQGVPGVRRETPIGQTSTNPAEHSEQHQGQCVIQRKIYKNRKSAAVVPTAKAREFLLQEQIPEDIAKRFVSMYVSDPKEHRTLEEVLIEARRANRSAEEAGGEEHGPIHVEERHRQAPEEKEEEHRRKATDFIEIMDGSKWTITTPADVGGWEPDKMMSGKDTRGVSYTKADLEVNGNVREMILWTLDLKFFPQITATARANFRTEKESNPLLTAGDMMNIVTGLDYEKRMSNKVDLIEYGYLGGRVLSVTSYKPKEMEYVRYYSKKVTGDNIEPQQAEIRHFGTHDGKDMGTKGHYHIIKQGEPYTEEQKAKIDNVVNDSGLVGDPDWKTSYPQHPDKIAEKRRKKNKNKKIPTGKKPMYNNATGPDGT